MYIFMDLTLSYRKNCIQASGQIHYKTLDLTSLYYASCKIFCSLDLKKEGNSYKIVNGAYYVSKYAYGSNSSPICVFVLLREMTNLKKYRY